jgi:hypothetical protein
MNNKITCIMLMALSATSYSLVTSDAKALQEKENMKILEKLGLPLPGSGIKLVPRSMLGLPPETIAKGERELQESQANGYVKTYTNRPKELLSITPEKVRKEISLNPGINLDSYTGLKADVRAFKLAFKFPSVADNKTLRSSNSPVKIIAAAPMGGFHEDLGGWSGACEYFNYESIGMCSYSVMNVKASHTAAQLAQEDVTYTIHDKATLLKPVLGSDSSGYIYELEWFDNDNFHQLECANMHYSNDINNSVIELAKKIDSN